MMQQMLLGYGGSLGEPMGNVHFVMAAGGGARGASSGSVGPTTNVGGGGAGGLIQSWGGATAVNRLPLLTLHQYAVTIGASATTYATNGSNTSIAGTDANGAFNLVAIGGGGGGHPDSFAAGVDANNGGSGGGGGAKLANGATAYVGAGGSGTANQGNDGGDGVAAPVFPWYCSQSWGSSFPQCAGYPGSGKGGSGGGAGSAGSSSSGGNGIGPLDITGTGLYYCGGGNGDGCGTQNGWDQAGGGGSSAIDLGKDGVLILHYSNAFAISNPGGGLTISTAGLVGQPQIRVSQITAGSGVIEFAAN